jgi:cell division protease FtsH
MKNFIVHIQSLCQRIWFFRRNRNLNSIDTVLKSFGDDVYRVFQIATAIDGEEVNIQSIIKGILSYKPAREIALKSTSYEDFELLDAVSFPEELPETIPAVKILNCLFEINDSLSVLSEVDNLDSFVSHLWYNTANDYWRKKNVIQSLSQFEKQLAAAAQALSLEFPYLQQTVQKFAEFVLDFGLKRFEASPKRTQYPLFLFSQVGNGGSALISKMAEKALFRYITIDETHSLEDLGKKLEDVPQAIIEVTGFNCYQPTGIHRHLFEYFLHGNLYIPENDTSFESIFSSSSRDITETLHRSIVIFHITIPKKIADQPDLTGEDIASSLRTMRKQKSDMGIEYDIPEEFWHLISSQNSIVMSQPNCEHLNEIVIQEIDYNVTFLKSNGIVFTMSPETRHRLAMLVLMKTRNPNSKNVREQARQLVLKCLQIKSETSSLEGNICELEIAKGNGDLPVILNKNPLKTENWNELLETQLRAQNYGGYTLDYDLETRKNGIKIDKYKLKFPKAVEEGHYLKPRPKERLDDVIGHDEAKKALAHILDYLKRPEKYHQMNVVPPLKIILYGPTGTGKTTLIRAFAGESGLPFFAVPCSDFLSQRWAGFGAMLIRSVFRAARRIRPCIVYLDEIDSFGDRDNHSSGDVGIEMRTNINTLLSELDGINNSQDIIICAATNRIQDIDPALLRFGRFGTQIKVQDFTWLQRETLVRKHLHPDVCEGDFHSLINAIVCRTSSKLSPADIIRLITESKLSALDQSVSKVNLKLVNETLDNILFGNKIRPISQELRKAHAVHLAGHVLLTRLLMPEKRLNRISIGCRGDTHRILQFSEDEKNMVEENMTRDEWIKTIIVFLGGPLAEQMLIGYWNVDMDNDFDLVCEMARIAVTDLGIGLGLNAIINSRLGLSPDGFEQEQINLKIKQLVEDCRDQTLQMLKQYESELSALSNELEQKEDMDQCQVDVTIGNADPGMTLMTQFSIENLMFKINS